MYLLAVPASQALFTAPSQLVWVIAGESELSRYRLDLVIVKFTLSYGEVKELLRPPSVGMTHD